jgi:ATP-GRASP peptide maturase of grasp-with-spasm system
MLLILSENDDYTTNDVIDWLSYRKIPFIRINDTSRINFSYLNIGYEQTDWEILVSEEYNTNSALVKSEDITSYWYRRGFINLHTILPKTNDATKNYLNGFLERYVNFNQKELIELMYSTLESKKHIGSCKDNFVTKLHNLQKAKRVGFKIPETMIISSKKELIIAKTKFQKLITKGIKSNGFNIDFQSSISCLTQLVEMKDIEGFSDTFAPSIVQKYIEKLFELRVFYLNEKCYSAAIFSQQDEKTKIDFRNYNEENPNRVVPYKLPQTVEGMICDFMKTQDLKSGSIDILVSDKMEYYFLEVNPVGQFKWISKNCNFYLEKEIANYFQ